MDERSDEGGPGDSTQACCGGWVGWSETNLL